MKVYQKNKRLSSEAREIIGGAALGATIMVDMSAFPCFIGIVCGVQTTPMKAVLAAIFAAQLTAALLIALFGMVRAIRKARAPRRLGMISAEVIRNCMEGKACSTKFSKGNRPVANARSVRTRTTS